MGNGQISVSEVAKHANPDDCWIVVNGKVYDLTKFAPNHPGGASSMLSMGMIQRAVANMIA
jgi:cytochrome b involved in lipid metabolism